MAKLLLLLPAIWVSAVAASATEKLLVPQSGSYIGSITFLAVLTLLAAAIGGWPTDVKAAADDAERASEDQSNTGGEDG